MSTDKSSPGGIEKPHNRNYHTSTWAKEKNMETTLESAIVSAFGSVESTRPNTWQAKEMRILPLALMAAKSSYSCSQQSRDFKLLGSRFE